MKFQKHYQELIKIVEDDSKSNAYFTDNGFDQTEAAYFYAENLMNEFIQKLTPELIQEQQQNNEIYEQNIQRLL